MPKTSGDRPTTFSASYEPHAVVYVVHLFCGVDGETGTLCAPYAQEENDAGQEGG